MGYVSTLQINVRLRLGGGDDGAHQTARSIFEGQGAGNSELLVEFLRHWSRWSTFKKLAPLLSVRFFGRRIEGKCRSVHSMSRPVFYFHLVQSRTMGSRDQKPSIKPTASPALCGTRVLRDGNSRVLAIGGAISGYRAFREHVQDAHSGFRDAVKHHILPNHETAAATAQVVAAAPEIWTLSEILVLVQFARDNLGWDCRD